MTWWEVGLSMVSFSLGTFAGLYGTDESKPLARELASMLFFGGFIIMIMNHGG